MKYGMILLLPFLFVLTATAQEGAALPLTDTVSFTAPPAERLKKLYVLPLISYSPETSLRLGTASIFLFRPTGCTSNTQLSSIRAPLTYTLNRQQKARFSYEIFMNDNRHILAGFIQWEKFPFFFYGIGSGSVEENEETYTSRTVGAQASYLHNVAEKFFLGAQLMWINNKMLEREPGGLLSQEGLIPGSEGSVSNGAGLIGRYDSRDNNLNPGRGLYLQSSLTTFPESFGSDFPFTKLEVDARKYFRPFQKHVLAFQLFAEHNWGNPPFELLALLGGDELMRGHYEGRFRDKTYWAAQAEYRLPINRRDWFGSEKKLGFRERWGLTGFAGLGAVASSLGALPDSELRYSLGFGIRYLVLPKERVNIRVDFGFGTQRPGFYFNVREAF
ncbi:MAG: BamA/TamA family outer membrane protein [Phaeodactylibacter sp.]|nr:BamA/TamA family outer membrane protein [Phaeodactylibacter sp.]